MIHIIHTTFLSLFHKTVSNYPVPVSFEESHTLEKTLAREKTLGLELQTGRLDVLTRKRIF